MHSAGASQDERKEPGGSSSPEGVTSVPEKAPGSSILKIPASRRHLRRGGAGSRFAHHCSKPPQRARYIGSRRIPGGSAGFRLCESVHIRIGADVVLTFFNASAVSRSDVASIARRVALSSSDGHAF